MMRRLLRSIYHGFSPSICSMLDSSISTTVLCLVVLLQRRSENVNKTGFVYQSGASSNCHSIHHVTIERRLSALHISEFRNDTSNRRPEKLLQLRKWVLQRGYEKDVTILCDFAQSGAHFIGSLLTSHQQKAIV
jgi:hypothetical protein